MSDPKTQDTAREQARSETNSNQGPAQTHTWDAPVREAYETEYQRQQQK